MKPTQLGYDQNPEICFKYCVGAARVLRGGDTYLWLDMESSPYVDGTLELFKRLRGAVGQGRRGGPGVSVPHRRGHRGARCGWAPRSVSSRARTSNRREVAFPKKSEVDDELLQAGDPAAAGRQHATGRAAAHRDARHRPAGSAARSDRDEQHRSQPLRVRDAVRHPERAGSKTSRGRACARAA